MRDSTKQQIFEACGRSKSAAEVMKFLLYVHRLRLQEWPGEKADSPRLWLEFSYSRLMEKTDLSRSTLIRAIKLLRCRGFIVLHQSEGERNLYQVNAGAIGRWLQKMPLFEQDDQCQDQCQMTPVTSVMVTPPPVSKWNGYQCHGDTGSPYMRLYPLPAASGEFADDDASQNENTEAEFQSLPAHEGERRETPASDQEREDLIDRLREVGIAKEHAEAYLTRHSRQKLQAAVDALGARSRRGDRIRNPAGLIIQFLRDPGAYGYELDPHGCWKPAGVIAREQRKIRSRDRPVEELDPRVAAWRAAAVAWDALGGVEQQQIRDQVDAEHPDLPQGQRLERYRQAALARRKDSGQQAGNDAGAMQGAYRRTAGDADRGGRAQAENGQGPGSLQRCQSQA